MNRFTRSASPALGQKAEENFRAYQDKMARRVDRMMACLLAAEWAGAILVALFLSPSTWTGAERHIHPHLWTILLLGPLVVGAPVALTILCPAQNVTRHLIAIAQMLISIILIDVTNGRIETHFHIFGSLAFLAFYRDWRVLITASSVIVGDHLVRGIWWPHSVYGLLTVSPWRSVEHAWWVIFEDIFLVVSIRQSTTEMQTMALREAELCFGAYHDVLTGLANRRLLQDRYSWYDDRWEDREKQGAILFVDLDRFKQVNDALGHAVGDKLLSQVAGRLTDVVRASDTVARVGGDEFVILVEHVISESVADQIGTSILSAFNLPFDVDEHQLLLSVSVGICFFPRDGEDLATLQSAADIAMYEAKTTGRNRCLIYSPEMSKREQTRKELGRDLYHAVSRAELTLHFQPQVAMDGAVSAFEALVRWNHPRRGQIAPSDFIPMAEQSGLIILLGEWILETACRECLIWHRVGHTLVQVAVNVSALQFEQPDFALLVERVLRDTGLRPSLLTLELTETVLMRDLDLANRHLMRLRELGVRIALDDFGTGYSSLSYLQSLPADTLKLDRSFVTRQLADRPAVLESIVAMAHRLGMQVIAEGVETSQQNQFLRDICCDQIQGFYYSEPIPADYVLRYLAIHADAYRTKVRPDFELVASAPTA